MTGFSNGPTERRLPLWVVYDKPADMPEKFVARKWYLDQPTSDVVEGATLDEVRGRLPRGLIRVAKHPSDEQHIVEMWV